MKKVAAPGFMWSFMFKGNNQHMNEIFSNILVACQLQTNSKIIHKNQTKFVFQLTKLPSSFNQFKIH